MQPNEQPIPLPVNRQSAISLTLGVLTVLSFCTGWLPIPFTGFICFPASFLLGISAFTFGVISLNKIQRQNESGRPMAWTGIAIGGFILLCALCMAVIVVALLIFAPGSIPTPPFINKYL